MHLTNEFLNAHTSSDNQSSSSYPSYNTYIEVLQFYELVYIAE